MMKTWGTALAAMLSLTAADMPPNTTSDPAKDFGAREWISDVSLSPDGSQVAYVAAGDGRTSAVYTLALSDGAHPRRLFEASGDPERLAGCHWVSDDRLVCTVYGVVKSSIVVNSASLPFTRVIAIDGDGGNAKMLSSRENIYSRGIMLGGGTVLDWMPGQKDTVLMERPHLPDDHLGTRLGSASEGLGVDRVNTRSLASVSVEPPKGDAARYVSDGQGAIRIMGVDRVEGTAQATGATDYFYRLPGSREWKAFGRRDGITRSGFLPLAVDARLNVVYGLDKLDGRQALYTIALDGSLTRTLIFSRPDVNVDDLVRIGRRGRVVGATYRDEKPEVAYFDPAIQTLASALGKALPRTPLINIVDTDTDETKLLLHAGSDQDPGVYYIFDRTKRELHTFLVARPELEGHALAKVTPVSYRAADGTMIPAYLTLPPGKENVKGLPAIVMPHGGPAYRDEWGFDWLSQYYAARGYAVLQPEFRGSSGYGDAWFEKNGFQSWRVAIGDVTDGGRWLVSSGVADPARLAIVGWSYGGYAALQSAVVAPSLFKAVVAIAPVTDLALLKQESLGWSNHQIVGDFIGSGAVIRDGSPAQNARAITAPVLLVHGTLDRNVGYGESTFMQSRLRAAGGKVDLLTFEGLDHQLDDSAARARMLERSDAFIKAAFGGG